MKTVKQSFVAKLQLLPVLALFLSVLAGDVAYAQITPSADSYTSTAAATTNYGASALLGVDGATVVTYLQFNLASVPATASISQATLKLYVNSVTTAGSFNVDYVNGSWAESTIDASNAPPLGGAIASNIAITTADKNQYILINVTSAVQAWLSGSESNNGIALVANSNFYATFDSKENTTTSHPAELDIAFAGGDGTITGVTTASGSGLSGGGTSGTLGLSLSNACAASQVLEWNGSAWACALAGTGTITGVTAGTDLTGGGSGGNVTLSLNTAALNSSYAQLGAANTFAPQQVIKGNGGNAIIGDPGCGSGFSGIGLTSSTLSGCANYTMIGKSSGDVYVNSTSSGYIHFRNGNSGSNSYNDLATIDNSGNVTIAGNLTIAGQENLNYKELINANSNYQALDVTQSGGNGDGIDATTTGTAANGVKGTSPYIGLYGNSTATGGIGYGVYGVTGAALGIGVYGSSSGALGIGVEGSTTGTNNGNAGVQGYASATSGEAVGVQGISKSPQAGFGVQGALGSTSGDGQSLLGTVGAGLWGDAGLGNGFPSLGVLGTADNSSAAYFYNNSLDNETVYIANAALVPPTGDAVVLQTSGRPNASGHCTINVNGDVGCTGKLGADAPVDGGARKVALYAMQSPENWFEDAGSGQLSSGSATIALDPTFLQTVNAGVEYHVFLTPNGDCKGLFVSQKSASSFEVHELGGGTSSIAFDYRIMAKRVGYENVRLTDVTARYKNLERQQQLRHEQMEQRREARAVSALPVPPATQSRIAQESK